MELQYVVGGIFLIIAGYAGYSGYSKDTGFDMKKAITAAGAVIAALVSFFANISAFLPGGGTTPPPTP
jgi:RsiW-degrading membrane proteinase PrsW (M82 family)